MKVELKNNLDTVEFSALKPGDTFRIGNEVAIKISNIELDDFDDDNILNCVNLKDGFARYVPEGTEVLQCNLKLVEE